MRHPARCALRQWARTRRGSVRQRCTTRAKRRVHPRLAARTQPGVACHHARRGRRRPTRATRRRPARSDVGDGTARYRDRASARVARPGRLDPL
jgi:hypothetical protein